MIPTNNSKDIIDIQCRISERDIGTRRFLKHMSMAANVTNDHYVPFVGDEAWNYQHTILKRQIPSAKINEIRQKESHDGITTETFHPDETSENINLYARVKLRPGETFIAIGKHVVTDSTKKMSRGDAELAA